MKIRPALEVADVFQQFGEEYAAKRTLSFQEKRVLKLISACRTAALGVHSEAKCNGCGHKEISYNSCRDRHCPKCQDDARAEWYDARRQELLPVPYFHVVFTLPEEFRLLAFHNKKILYEILFRAASETLLEVAKDPRHLGARIGFFGILHTWGQNLLHHPHVHFIVPGGGLSPDRTHWIPARKRFFLPLRVLKPVFRGKFLNYLEEAYREGKLSFRGDLERLLVPGAFSALLLQASRHRWAIQAKPPFGGPEIVLKYLARYTYRVALSNSRLLSLRDGKVTFRWKDYSDGDQIKLMSLEALEFIRRFLLHVLPPGFRRIRYYGFFSCRNRKSTLELCRRLLNAKCPSESQSTPADNLCAESSQEREGDQKRTCPVCKGQMVLVLVGERRPSVSNIPLLLVADTS